MIIRNDDVSPNTNLVALNAMCRVIKDHCPEAELWSCISLFSKSSADQAVYPGQPFKGKDRLWFYDLDRVMHFTSLIPGVKVSHGLIHTDHSRLSRDAQEMSILTSCNVLGTKIFVPPFSKYNADTESICRGNGISLSKTDDGWKSLESEPFDPNHKLWFFHSWRYSVDDVRDTFENGLVINERVAV